MERAGIQPEDDIAGKLLATARALVLRGDSKFSIAALCAEAGVDRAAFRKCFAGKTALMAALMQDGKSAPSLTNAEVAPAADAWLERRLRVFERALNALEAKAEATQREQARRMAQLEEKLGARPLMPEPQAETPAMVAVPEPPAPPQKPAPLLPPFEKAFPKIEMTQLLNDARVAAQQYVPPEPPPPRSKRWHWLAIGVLSLAVLFLCIGLTLGHASRVAQQTGGGISHRHVAATGRDRIIALADAGDSRAQTALAIDYLRGDSPAAALRWSRAAARGGQPMAQYLLGALYQQGEGVAADPVRAFGYFAQAAAQGNLKAMHNLAIAYAQGMGTAKNESLAAQWFAQAAERGYIDSAFDLAVMYERGLGVRQDLKQALEWYAIAGQAGDASSQARADFLRGQLPPAQAQLAFNAARDFAPLPAPREANSLPKL